MWVLILLVLAVGCGSGQVNSAGPCTVPVPLAAPIDCADGSRASVPFTCVEFTPTCDIRVEVDGSWYDLVSIDGAPIADLIAAMKIGCADGELNWRKRFAEDLDKIMEAASCPIGSTVMLGLRRDDGTVVTLTDVPVSAEKRQATRECWPTHDHCEG